MMKNCLLKVAFCCTFGCRASHVLYAGEVRGKRIRVVGFCVKIEYTYERSVEYNNRS